MQIKLNQKVIILLLSYTRSDSYKKYVFEYTKNKRFVETVLLSTHETLHIKGHSEIYHIRNQMFHIFYSTYADASMYQGSICRRFTLSLQLPKSKNSVLASSANMSKLLLLLR